MSAMPDYTARTSGDNSPIIGQGGTVHGNISLYYTAPGATSKEKYEVALRRLDAGNAGFAEELLAEVLKTPMGNNNPGVLYHYLVASLSGRSLGELDATSQGALNQAHRMLARGSAGTLDMHHLRNLIALIDLAARANEDRQPSEIDSAHMRQAYSALPLNHRRHLDDLLAGPGKDAAFEDFANMVRKRRSGDIGNRINHAWKFFEPDPTEPKDLTRFLPAAGSLVKASSWAGAVLLLVGLIGVIVQLAGTESDQLLTGLVLAATGTLLGAGSAWRRIRDRELLLNRQATLAGPQTAVPGDLADDLQATLKMVGVAFDHVPHGGHPSWKSMTAGLRLTLAHEITTNYDPADVRQGRLWWLARWHAEQSLQLWRSRRMLDHEQKYRDRKSLKRARTAGIVMLIVAALGLADALPSTSIPDLLPLGVAVTGFVMLWLTLLGRTARQSAYQVISQWAAERYASEHAEWEQRSIRLRDRPSDGQMAAWLADDVDVFKASILDERRIRPSEVVCSMELATEGESARRARQAFGPIRYDHYLLTLFLLTHTGVWQFQSHLDFCTGDLFGEHQRCVPYGALREVEVTQLSVRHALGGPAPSIYHQKLRVCVHDGIPFEIALGNFDDLRADSEPSDLVTRLAMDATGVNVARHVLETVVVDGPEWIVKERSRRRYAGIRPASPDTLGPEQGRGHSLPPGR